MTLAASILKAEPAVFRNLLRLVRVFHDLAHRHTCDRTQSPLIRYRRGRRLPRYSAVCVELEYSRNSRI